MEVTNVKFHSYIKSEFIIHFQRLLNSDLKKDVYMSFFVIRLGRFVFNCFYTGYINITGVKRTSAISTALVCLTFALDLPMKTSVFEKTDIDNISANCCSLETRTINLYEKKAQIDSVKFKTNQVY